MERRREVVRVEFIPIYNKIKYLFDFDVAEVKTREIKKFEELIWEKSLLKNGETIFVLVEKREK